MDIIRHPKTGEVLIGIYLIVCIYVIGAIVDSIEFISDEINIYEFTIRMGISVVCIIGLLNRSSMALNIVLWFTGIGMLGQGLVVLATLGGVDYSDTPVLDIIFNIIILSVMVWMFKYLRRRRVRVAYNDFR